jgi:protein TonB
MALRFLTSAVLAGVITMGLFFFMQFLISMGKGQADDVGPGNVIEFVRLKRESDLQLRKRELPKKEEPPEPPPPPDLQMAAPADSDGSEMAIAAPSVNVDIDIGGGLNMGVAPSDTDATPLVRVSPIYPPRATERGIEGYVVVRYTIAVNGTVKDPEVIDSKPSRIFDRAAIRAVKKWKFKPKIVDGEAVEQPGKVIRFPFELEK